MSLSENGQKHAGWPRSDQGAEKHALRATVTVSTAEIIRLLRVSSYESIIGIRGDDLRNQIGGRADIRKG